MNSCNEYQQQISQYIDNQLEDSDTSELFRHLGDCEECRDFLKSILKLRSAIFARCVAAAIDIWQTHKG